MDAERDRGASSTFFLLAGHADRHDGASPGGVRPLRPRLVETILEGGGEVGLHGELPRGPRRRAARGGGDGARGARSRGPRPALPLPPRRPAREPRAARLRSACATTRRSGSRTRPASGRASRSRSAPGTSPPTARSTSSRSRSRRWTSRSARSATSASPRGRRRPAARAPRLRGRARRRLRGALAHGPLRPGDRPRLGPPLPPAARRRPRAWRRLLSAGELARRTSKPARPSCENRAVSSLRSSLARSGAYRSLRRTLRRAAHPRELAFQRRVRRGFEERVPPRLERARHYEEEIRQSGLLEHIREKRKEYDAIVGAPGATATRRAGSASPSARTCTRSCGR